MREIVYLSESKLRQFVPAPRRIPRVAALRVTTPFGGVDMDAPVKDGAKDQLRHLHKVCEQVQLAADWYAVPDLRPGQWVQFEAPLRCVTLSDAHQDLVLFVDRARGGDVNPSAQGCRLLMHGSVRHLRGRTPIPVDGPEPEGANSLSSLGTAFATRAGQVVEALTRSRDPLATEQTQRQEAVRLPARGVEDLLHALDDEDGSFNVSALMTGYARVTGILPHTGATSRCVVASPLVVEYAADTAL
ncbi:SAVMC3_10250 family protein [Streptomyces sp. NBC_01187]|uniref:SAVMC3_10250 family protein n=1 Tax=Streptomyces sp. NBC_01187 TaxID=2903766 RepID=UPI00386CBF64|nr:SAVMC3_10250 family protein [Streptomyces sp. NBC_01187]